MVIYFTNTTKAKWQMPNGHGQKGQRQKPFCVWQQSKEQMSDPRAVQALDLDTVPCKCDKA